MRRAYLVEIAWVSSLGQGAWLYGLTAASLDAAEIERRPTRAREEAVFLLGLARSYGRRRICRRRAKGVRVRARVLLQQPRVSWRGKARAGPAFCLVSPYRETGSAMWRYRSQRDHGRKRPWMDGPCPLRLRVRAQNMFLPPPPVPSLPTHPSPPSPTSSP